MHEEEDSRKAEIQKIEHLQILNLFSITAKQVFISCSFTFHKINLRIIDILTKSYKITIACFNTNNLRGIDPYSRKVYYLDDPVHLLVSCAELQKCDCNFVHQVFGAVARDCSSLDN